ncbi:MAG: hypothetical protein NC237_11940, partial [Eubacterium sp.]|nr:hypothetical protein [Eubacterium sp.]
QAQKYAPHKLGAYLLPAMQAVGLLPNRFLGEQAQKYAPHKLGAYLLPAMRAVGLLPNRFLGEQAKNTLRINWERICCPPCGLWDCCQADFRKADKSYRCIVGTHSSIFQGNFYCINIFISV